ncbi:MAG: glycosyltransferase [Patescibacteria group bacterium]
MKKVLIVSLRVGAGHVKAAEALEREIVRAHPGVEVKNIDFLDYASFLSNKFYGKLAVDVIGKLPELYAWLYKNADMSSSNEARLIFDRMNAQELKKQMVEFNPDLIVCTHFIPASLFVHWRSKYKYDYKIAVTVTDYEAHKLWADRGVDRYFVATPDVKKSLVGYGIQTSRIFCTGIPIDVKFSKRYNRALLCRKYHIAKTFTVGIFSGGFGMGPVKEIWSALEAIPGQFQIIVVAGNNHALKKEMTELAQKSRKKVVVLGFTDTIEEIMAVVDLIISKPGGLTTAETLAMGVPLLISNPLPGQEEANARYIMKHKAAYRSDDPLGVSEITRIILENTLVLRKLRLATRRIAKPYATAHIVRSLQSL